MVVSAEGGKTVDFGWSVYVGAFSRCKADGGGGDDEDGADRY